MLHSRGKRAQTNQIDRPFQVHVVQLKRYTYGQRKTDAEFFKKNSKFATTHTEWKKSKPKDKIVVCAPHGLLTILFVALCRTHVI